MSFRTRVPNQKWRTGWDAAGEAAIPTELFPARCTHRIVTGSTIASHRVLCSFCCVNYPSLFPPSGAREHSYISLAARWWFNWIYLRWRHNSYPKSDSNKPEFAHSSQLWGTSLVGILGGVDGLSSSEFQTVSKEVSRFQSQVWWRPQVEQRVRRLLQATVQRRTGLMRHNQNYCKSNPEFHNTYYVVPIYCKIGFVSLKCYFTLSGEIPYGIIFSSSKILRNGRFIYISCTH